MLCHAVPTRCMQVRTRMESEQGISFTEFTYQLLQGYDFVHLCREHGVRVQVRVGERVWVSLAAATVVCTRPQCTCAGSTAWGCRWFDRCRFARGVAVGRKTNRLRLCNLPCRPRRQCRTWSSDVIRSMRVRPVHGAFHFVCEHGRVWEFRSMAQHVPRVKVLCRSPATGATPFSHLSSRHQKLTVSPCACPCPMEQIGGSDQWGNITAGTDLIRRLLGGEDREPPACYGLTFPLLVRHSAHQFVLQV